MACFVSINCGYAGPPFVDKLTGIRWHSDQYFSTGVPGTAPPPKGKQWGPYDVEATMRVFTEYPVNCYNIPVAKPGRYLLRLVMYYGNYDKAKSPPAFNVSFGISFAATVVLALKERVVSEIIGQVDSTELEVCFVSIYGKPLVNALELRPLPPESYVSLPDPSGVMLLWWRLFCANDSLTNRSLRYPYDPLDRIWDADGVMATSGGAASSTLMFDYSFDSYVFGTPINVKPAIGARAVAAATSAAFGTGDSGETVGGESASEEAGEAAGAEAAATATAAAAAAAGAGTAAAAAAAAVVGEAGGSPAEEAAEAVAEEAAEAAEQAITANGTANAVPPFLQLTARTVPQAPTVTMGSSSGLEYQFQFLESPANFQLIMYFANVEGRVKRAGDMVFDILLNEQVVVARFDLFLQLQGVRAVRAGTRGIGASGVSGSGVGGSAAVESGGGDVTAHVAAVGLTATPAGVTPTASPLPPPAATVPSTPPPPPLFPAAPAPASAASRTSSSSSSSSSATDSSLYAQQVVMVVVNFTSVDLYTPAVLLLRPAASSRLPPAISGIEMYEVFPAAKPTPPAEVAALRDFQSLLGAPASLAGWQGADPCNPIKWAGIQCIQAQGDSASHVSGIYLGNYSLHGPISPLLANISFLQHLWVNDNELVKEIPSSLGDLGDLSTLLLQNNHLTGQVPQSLTNLTNLVQLNVANNSLTGVFPFNMTTQFIQVVATGNDLCSPQGLYDLPNCGALPPPPPSPPSPSAPPPTPSPISPAPPSEPSVPPSPTADSTLATAATDAATGAAAAAAAATAAAAAAGGAAAVAEAAHNGQKTPPNGLAVEPAPFTVPPTHVQRMSLAELEEATGGFCEEQMIGAGGFGPVYRGVLANGRVVAVKRRAVDSMQGSTEFNNELKFLSKIRHPHLVALIAFCEEQGQQLLVYEFMAQGNLREHLYDRLGAPRGRLRWLQRLSIAVGAAKGIEYLHVALRPSIIHRDIKTTNILLDDSLCAKVADFGLSRLGPQDNTHVSTNVKGTAGYLDPEYYTVQQLTDRSDVFSFGVVLLELVSGRQPIDLSRPRVDWNIIDWARKHLQQGDIEAIVDPTLPPSEYLLDAMWKVAEVGILCVEPMGINRPSISEVVRELGEAVAMELSNTPAPHGDYMMLRKVQQGVLSPPVPQEKRHFSAEDNPRFASPFLQPGFQPRAGGRDFESAREPAGGYGVGGDLEGKRRMSDGEVVAMPPHRATAMWIAVVIAVSLALAPSAAALRYGQSEPPPKLDYASCAAEVEEWVDVQMAETAEVQWQREERMASGESPMPQTLFFLHVARAGGRTYHQCFLSTLMPSTVQCNMSYHVLRDDPTMGCRLLATHDDYGMTTQLPPGAATGVTTLFREPLDRVLSMYEFSVHISGRSMGLDLKQLPDETLYAARRKMREHYRNLVPTDTRNVWPWTLLSVTMEEDLWDRRDFTGIPPPPVGFDEGRDDMYSRAHLVMPLRDFIELPLAHDVVHNGATFQLAGITNNSVLPEAKRLRQCVLQHPELGGEMLKLAKARVDALIHLGFTDRMEESIELLLAVIDRSLSSQAFTLPGKNPRGRCKRPKKKAKERAMPWKSIREQYAECLKDQMELTQLNELIAFRHMGPLKFSRKERARIPEDVMRRIKELNALDLELTEYARDKYTQMLDKYRPMMEAIGNPSTDRC
ncbi:unnamed protein product [Closterium sp. Yama58-4]|nr:unnamed protein product [Closterium sp. Yama58-4]